MLNAKLVARNRAEQKMMAITSSVDCLDILQPKISVNVFLDLDATVLLFCFKILKLPIKSC